MNLSELASLQRDGIGEYLERLDPGQWTDSGSDFPDFAAFSVDVWVEARGNSFIRYLDADGESHDIAVAAGSSPQAVAGAAIALRELGDA